MLSGYKNHISVRFILNIILIHAFLMGLIVVDTIDRETDFTRDQLLSKGIILSELLATNTASSLLNNDIVAMQERISQLKTFDSISTSFILDAQERVRASDDKSYFNLVLSDTVSIELLEALKQSSAISMQRVHNGMVDTMSKVIVDNQTIGYTRIILDTASLDQQIQLLTEHGLFYILIAIVLGSLFAWLSIRTLTKRLLLLTNAANKMANKEFDIPLPQSNSDDEIGIMTRAMQTMQTSLYEHIEEQNKQHELLKNLINTIPARIFWKDRDSRYIGCNPLFLQDASIEYEEDIIGKTDYDMVWKEQAEAYRADDAEVMDAKEGKYYIIEPQTQKDGRTLWLNTSKVPLVDPLGNVYGILGVYIDITQQKELEAKLREAKKHAEQTSQFKSEFLANMSHEIRTPMNAIMGFIENLKKGETDPQRTEKFNLITTTSHTLLQVINDILDLSKIESGKLELSMIPVNVETLFTQSCRIFDEQLESKNIRLETDIDEHLPGCILCDDVRFSQILFNLLSNALKFTPDGGNIQISLHYDPEPQHLHVSIQDDGEGIAQEQLSKIFESFTQADTSTTCKFGGTGLGLSISARLIDKMGGELKVKSTLGQGSTFYFALPVQLCDEALLNVTKHIASQEDNSTDKSQRTSHGKVLIVEDNKTNQLLLGMILDDVGLAYDLAQDGLEAVSMFKVNHYDLILMDENMPRMNGITATREIRIMEAKTGEHIPIIAVTANALSEDKEKFLNAGMDDYIAKPYSETDITDLLQRYLG